MKNIFITGTDTSVGKTIASAWICAHTRATYWKPFQTGGDSDKTIVSTLSPHTNLRPERYLLAHPLSPYDAAKKESITFDVSFLKKADCQQTLIEGAGGALVPITSHFCMADIIVPLRATTIIVAASRLGFINHILLTVEALRSRRVPLLGLIINGKLDLDLLKTIKKFSSLPVLSILPTFSLLNQENLLQHPLPTAIQEVLS